MAHIEETDTDIDLGPGFWVAFAIMGGIPAMFGLAMMTVISPLEGGGFTLSANWLAIGLSVSWIAFCAAVHFSGPKADRDRSSWEAFKLAMFAFVLCWGMGLILTTNFTSGQTFNVRPAGENHKQLMFSHWVKANPAYAARVEAVENGVKAP